MIPILVKADDVRNGKKAKDRCVWLRTARKLMAGADPHRFPSFYGNRSDFSELLRNPKKGTLGIKKSRTFRKGAHLEGTRCFGNRSPFILDPRLNGLIQKSMAGNLNAIANL